MNTELENEYTRKLDTVLEEMLRRYSHVLGHLYREAIAYWFLTRRDYYLDHIRHQSLRYVWGEQTDRHRKKGPEHIPSVLMDVLILIWTGISADSHASEFIDNALTYLNETRSHEH